MDIGDLQFFEPKDNRLRLLIKGYCIHTSSAPNFNLKIRFYQNTTNTISIYKDSITTGAGNKRTQTYNPGKGINTILVGLIDGYQDVEFIGQLQRVAIIFHAGGLNHFINQPLSQFLKPNFSEFNYFKEEFEQIIPLLLAMDEVKQQRGLLDDFFIDKFLGFTQQKLLKSIDLINDDNSIKVHELASSMGIHRRTLLRQFKNHLGLSIEAYKRSRRFRNALLNFQRSKSGANLTDIAHDSQYYDQADFSHQLKTTCGLTPKQLFSKLKIVDDTLFWVH